MKRIVNWLLWASVALVIPFWVYVGYLYFTNGLARDPIASIIFFPAMLGCLLFVGSLGCAVYLWVKERKSEKGKQENKGRRELARFRIKHRYPVTIVSLLFIAGVVWGWNVSGGIYLAIILLLA